MAKSTKSAVPERPRETTPAPRSGGHVVEATDELVATPPAPAPAQPLKEGSDA